MNEEISREEIAALLARESEEMTREEAIKMREVTPEERESIDKYIKSISKPTGVDFFDLEQKPKTGHWIIISPTDMYCSECNEIEHLDTSRKFCAYCGTRMSEDPTGSEPQESEDKE